MQEKRCEPLSLRLRPDEDRLIRRAAQAADTTMTELARAAIVGAAVAVLQNEGEE